MPIVDERGRVAGRINLIDAVAAVVIVVLVPVAYGAYLLFRTPQPKLRRPCAGQGVSRPERPHRRSTA